MWFRYASRQACQKFGSFEPPNWRDSRITKVAFLDAAYRGVGGDRCVFGEIQFGYEVDNEGMMKASTMLNALANQVVQPKGGRQILALIDLMIVPVVAERDSDQPEDQIVQFVNQQLGNRGIPNGHFFYDAGARTTLVSAFARNNMIECNTVDCGGRPSESPVSAEIQKQCCDYYSKFVTELWFSVRYVVESRQFRGMTEEACTEFGQREWKLVSGNRIEIESKKDMKVKTGRSPDIADAIAIGVYGARKLGFLIQKLASPSRVVDRNQGWKDDLRKKARALSDSGVLNYS